MARQSAHKAGKIVVGAHLDSVLEGPGINDNGAASRRSWRSPRRWPVTGGREPGAIRVLGRRGGRPAGLRRTTSRRSADEEGEDRAEPELRHAGVAELRALRLRRRRLDHARRGPARRARRRSSRCSWLLRLAGAGDGADGVRRPLGLRAVHRRRHPGRGPVLRCGGHQDARAGGALRRRRRRGLRPLLPPVLRHVDNINYVGLDQLADGAAHAIAVYATKEPLDDRSGKEQGQGEEVGQARQNDACVS